MCLNCWFLWFKLKTVNTDSHPTLLVLWDKPTHFSAKMNSNNWRLVFFLKPTIELRLQVRWNKAIPRSHWWYCTRPNIMSTKYRSLKYIKTSYKCTSIMYLIKESWNFLYIQVIRSSCGHTHKHQVLYHIFSNYIGEDPMSYNASPK